MSRAFFVWLHRWTGLVIAVFLMVVGITGSLLAFYNELNELIAPELFPTERGGVSLDAATLAIRAEAIVPGARVKGVYFGYDSPIAEIAIEARPGADPLNFDYIYLDLYTGEERGRLMWGTWPTSRAAIMPFVYNLHYSLVAGDIGMWILGLVALAWTIDCFAGFYLTLPEPSERARKRFLTRWKPAWLVKTSGSFYRLNFDLHRAGGLWFWALLFVLAWSSVYMNLNGFYSRAMSLVFDYQPPFYQTHSDPLLADRELMKWEKALQTGRTLMADVARKNGFAVEREVSLYLQREKGAWEYRTRSSLDIANHNGRTSIWFDAFTGELRVLEAPTGMRAGNTITTWLYELHKANVFGLPYRILECVLGVVIAMLSGTGVYIWWRKRRARRRRAAGAALPDALAQEFR
ncbi:PepSY domain-containing protein [Methylocystis sp. H62]|uniref:PepSY-associated TM helix domain-containing protein n=1 Tax=Methylocystis sp. H62 TaxID=2785789 RepID=UPI0018C304BB|nr:PepSY-associated TM helix domain-containing protein [Methylocystis sp. H62]MBG0792278.1 PepSY domain-containing protein [Methylocystis sp. H62]